MQLFEHLGRFIALRLSRNIWSVVVALGVASCGSGPEPAAGSARARTGPPPALGGHALLAQDQGKGTNPATTAPIATQPRGSTLLAVSMGRTTNFVAPTDSYGNAWSLIGRRNPYANGPFYTAVWWATDGKGGNGHTLSARKPSDDADEISLAFIEVANASTIKDSAYSYAKRGTPSAPGSVTTDGPATLIAIWGGDGPELTHTAVPSDGFQVTDAYLTLGPTSGVQIAIAAKQVAAAGTYSMSWAASPAQGAACYLIAVE